jgi:hypothetical protein
MQTTERVLSILPIDWAEFDKRNAKTDKAMREQLKQLKELATWPNTTQKPGELGRGKSADKGPKEPESRPTFEDLRRERKSKLDSTRRQAKVISKCGELAGPITQLSLI